MIVDEELAAAGAPPRPSLGYLVQGILEHGNDDVRRRFLPGIVNGRDRWCQGFSEPDAGSDLASLRTRADRDGDEYVITGHKVWTSYSDVADWCLVLARTDHDVPKHKGISAFRVSMRQPGIEQRPLKMINGITSEFGEVTFDGARVPASDMIGSPGEGWRLAMTVVSHEREPGELGYVARYKKLVKELTGLVRADPDRYGPEQVRDLGWALVEAEMLRLHVCRRLSDRLDGITHGPEGSVDKLLMTEVEQAVGHAALAVGGVGPRCRRRHLAEGVPLQPRPERHGRHVADPAQPRRHPHPGAPHMTTEVRPSRRDPGRGRTGRSGSSASTGPSSSTPPTTSSTRAWPPCSPSSTPMPTPGWPCITGNGRAFSAGGDFGYIDELAKDAELRHVSLTHGRQIVTGMVACRVPVVAAVNGPAVGLGCSIVALSDIVYMAESAHLADPHVMVGLVAADGGPVTWPLLTSLQLAKEYALTGDRIPAQRAAQIGLVNHVCPDDEVLDQALACARRIAKLPRRATEDTKRILNMHLERAVLATLDFALTAEDRSFTSPELRANLDRLLSRET